MTLDDVDDLEFVGLVKTPLLDAILTCERRGWPLPKANASTPAHFWQHQWTLGCYWARRRLVLLVFNAGDDLSRFFLITNTAALAGYRVLLVPLGITEADLEQLLGLVFEGV